MGWQRLRRALDHRLVSTTNTFLDLLANYRSPHCLHSQSCAVHIGLIVAKAFVKGAALSSLGHLAHQLFMKSSRLKYRR